MVLQRFTDTAVDPGTRQHRHQLTARGQQQVDQARGGRGDVAADDQHLIASDRQPVARFTGARPRQRLLGGHPHRAVPGARGGAGHRVAVVDRLPLGVVHRQRGQPLNHRTGGHRHDVDAPSDRRGAARDEFLGGDVAVGQHHDLSPRPC